MTFFQRIKTPFTESAANDQARTQPRMRQVGGVLQERREELGLDLDEIGAMLRIRPAYLAALEQGRTTDLPGPAYAIGFIRAYADFLGLNTEQVLARFKAEALGATARPGLGLPVPLGERSLPGGAMVLVALILALCGYGIWYYLSTGDRNRPERVAAVPAALRAPQPVLVAPPPVLVAPPPAQPEATAAANPPQNPAPPVTSTGMIGAAASPSPGTPSSAAPPPRTAPQVAAVSPPPALAPQAISPAPVPAAKLATAPQPAATMPPPAAPAASPAPTAASKVAIRALADCWIQIRAPDQSIVFSRILKSGETYAVPSRPGLSLRTGNAGALEIAVDGKAAPPIGGIGTLRRDVTLDPAALAAGTAVHG